MSARSNPPNSNVRKDSGADYDALSNAIKRRRQRLQEAQQDAKSRLKALDDQISLELDAIDSRLTAWVEFQGDLEEQQRQSAIEREQLDRASEKIQRRQAETETQRHQIARKLLAQRRDARQSHESGNAELALLRQQNQELQHTLSGLQSELEQLRSAHAEVTRRLADMSSHEISNSKDDGDNADVLEELQDNLEHALDEIQALRDENEALKEKLATATIRKTGTQLRARRPAADSASSGAGGSDWESQKKRLLEQLEGDSYDGDCDEESGIEALDSDGTDYHELVSQAEQLVAERDREICALQQKLLAAEAAAKSRISNAATERLEMSNVILDNDTVIAQERDRLKKLQDEWEERSRKAEVETAMERARLARMRTEFEEKLRDLEAKQQQLAQRGPTGTGSAKPERERRWLDHLSRPRDPDKS